MVGDSLPLPAAASVGVFTAPPKLSSAAALASADCG